MSHQKRTAAYTSQMLAFAHKQLELLEGAASPFEQRVLIQAFLSQLIQSFLSYLEEIAFLNIYELPQLGLVKSIVNKLDAQAGDFRSEEISKLLREAKNKSWLLELFELYELGMFPCQPQKQLQEEDISLIVAVPAVNPRPWWEYDLAELRHYWNALNELIQRQREQSVEN